MLDEIRLLKELETRARLFREDGTPVGSENVFLSIREVMDIVRRHTAEDTPLPSLDALSWHQIHEAANAGTLQSLLPSGTVLPCVLENGDNVGLIVGYKKSGQAYFVFRKAMGHLMPMNTKGCRCYEVADLAKYAELQAFSMLPWEIRSIVRTTSIGSGKMHIFCPSHNEITRECEDDWISIFESQESLQKVQAATNQPCSWWLRSNDGKGNFDCVMKNGTVSSAQYDEVHALILMFSV